MRIDVKRFELAQAKTGKTLIALGIPRETARNIRDGKNLRPETVGKIAKALECLPEDIIAEDY